MADSLPQQQTEQDHLCGHQTATILYNTQAERSASSFGVLGAVGEAMNDVRRSRNRSFALAGALRTANSQSRPAPIADVVLVSAPQMVR